MLRLRGNVPVSSLESYDPFTRPFGLIDDLFGRQVAMLPKEDITRNLRPVLNIDLIETDNQYDIHAGEYNEVCGYYFIYSFLQIYPA